MHFKYLYVAFLCLIALFTTSTNSDAWPAEGARWWYSYFPHSESGCMEIYRSGDTVINGSTVDVLKKITCGSVDPIFYRNEYTYEDSGVVYIFTGEVFDTLFNFNALPGDSWTAPFTNNLVNFCNKSTKVVVLDTSRAVIAGLELRQVIVEYYLADWGSLQDTITERTGSQWSLLLAYEQCYLSPLVQGPLRCYMDADIDTIYPAGWDMPCDTVIAVGLQKTPERISFTAYPNPASDLVWFEWDFGFPVSNLGIVVATTDGRIIQNLALPSERSGNQAWETGNLKPGIYHYSVSGNKYGVHKALHEGKLIIE